MPSRLTAAILGAFSAYAQPGGSPAGRGAGDGDNAGLRLLTNNQVQKDLQLTDEQRVQILTLTMELRENRGMVGQRLTEILTLRPASAAQRDSPPGGGPRRPK